MWFDLPNKEKISDKYGHASANHEECVPRRVSFQDEHVQIILHVCPGKKNRAWSGTIGICSVVVKGVVGG